MIVSTTDTCNLACAGCYACANKKKSDDELNDVRVGELLDKAYELGVSIVMLAARRWDFHWNIGHRDDANIDSVLQGSFVEQYLQKGCRLFVEYVPMESGTEPMVLSEEEKHHLSDISQRFSAKYPTLFIPFPGDEEQYEGCLAAGRGFVHISAGGNVELYPFAPFSDVSLKDTPLKEALTSRFLSRIRENHHLLKEGDGGCTLWHNCEWLQEIIYAGIFMRAIMESSFSIAYLITVITLGIIMIAKSNGN